MLGLSVGQVEYLKALYVRYDTPVDRFISHWDDLIRLVDELNEEVRRSFKPDAVLHFMMNQRKRGQWPRIRRDYSGRRVKQAS